MQDDGLFPYGVADEHQPLLRFRMNDMMAPAWRPVIYDEESQRRAVVELLAPYGIHVDDEDRSRASQDVPWQLYARASLTALMCTFKHSGFRDEREVRFIAPMVNRQTRSRPGPGDRRYLPVQARDISGADRPATQLPVREVVLAPNADINPSQTIAEIEEIMHAYGCDAPVRASTIPYRWL